MMAFVSKEEYLKRYLSGSDFEDKKKKRKRKPKQGTALQSRMKIVDDDITVNDVAPSSKEEADLYEDEAPTVAGLVDERPEEIQQLEAFRSGAQWKKFNEKEAAKRRHDSDSDQSPVRQRHDSDSDGSPPRRQRHDSGSDQSPPRRQRNDSSSDQSPPRRQRKDSDSDESPPRRQRKDSGSDQSPPRRQRRDSSSDQSPPRRKKQNSDSDQSPPRRRRQNSDSDQSPPRKSSGKRKSEDVQKATKKRTKPSRFDAPLEPEQDDRGRAKKTLAGLTAGLSTARAMRMENDAKRKREQDMFDQASEAMLGRNSKTVFRDKETGKRRNLVKEGEAEAKENAIKEELLAKYKAWGKGLAQQEAQDKRTQEALAVADRPLARLAGDEHLEAELREQEREGDPMLAYLRKKKTKSVAKDIPRYKGPQPPANRFNLWPGYRWDGIDRSNGFEKSLFSKRSERKAVEQDAYKWSVEDM